MWSSRADRALRHFRFSARGKCPRKIVMCVSGAGSAHQPDTVQTNWFPMWYMILNVKCIIFLITDRKCSSDSQVDVFEKKFFFQNKNLKNTTSTYLLVKFYSIIQGYKQNHITFYDSSKRIYKHTKTLKIHVCK